jgi:hypothetical protein
MLVAFALLYPDAVVYVYFLIPMKAAHMAILFGVIEFFSGAAGSTPGVARFAHLGGMITGYVYIRWWWVWKLNLKSFFKGILPSKSEESPEQARVRRRPSRALPPEPEANQEMVEVDRILDKILASGMDSLTENEREIMQRYSRRNKLS